MSDDEDSDNELTLKSLDGGEVWMVVSCHEWPTDLYLQPGRARDSSGAWQRKMNGAAR